MSLFIKYFYSKYYDKDVSIRSVLFSLIILNKTNQQIFNFLYS